MSKWQIQAPPIRIFVPMDDRLYRDQLAGIAEFLYLYACQSDLYPASRISAKPGLKHARQRKQRRPSHD